MPSSTPLQHAAAELLCAADLAEDRAAGNLLDPWAALAGTIRLVASGLDPMPELLGIDKVELRHHLDAALTALDRVQPQEAPSDFPFWRAHVADLTANATALETPFNGANGAHEGGA